MKLNKYFFKKHLHTLQRRLIDALRHGKTNAFMFLGRLSHLKNLRFLSQKNTLLQDGKHFLKILYIRLVVRAEYTKRDLIMLFIIAFSVGIAWKVAAAEIVTIGFEDYTLPPKKTLLDLNAVQKNMIENGSTFLDNDNVQGGVCSE